MNNQRQQHNWWIDVLLLMGYLFCFYLNLTGIILHQWLGVTLGVLVFVHTLVHWDWVTAITRRLFARCGSRNRWYYLIDMKLGLGFVVIVETGLVISTWFNLSLPNYAAWLDIHIYSSVATLALTVIKIGLHWRWVVNITARIFSTPRQPAPTARPVPVPVLVQPQVARTKARTKANEGIDRRKFLALMGVVGFSSAIAIYNVLYPRAFSLAEAVVNTDTVNGAIATEATAEVVQAQQLTETTEPVLTSEAAATATPQSTVTPASIASALDAAPACTVRCPRGCSYPGHCRRYTDLNNNRKCDLGECL